MKASQTLCVIAHGYNRGVGHVRGLGPQLDQIFRSSGCVHFAALGMLPPAPGDTALTLVIELAVDPQISPDDLVDRLVQADAGTDALWDLCADEGVRALNPQSRFRADWLRSFLLSSLHRADAGFVGMRDRTVGQVLTEGELYREGRTTLEAALRSPMSYERAGLAQRIRAWCLGRPELGWVSAPARRSFWRANWMSEGLRAILVLLGLPLPLPRDLRIPAVGAMAVIPVLGAIVCTAGVLALLPLLMVFDWRSLVRSAQLFGAFVPWSEVAVWSAAAATAAAALIAFLGFKAIRSIALGAFLLLVLGTVAGLVAMAVLIASAIQDVSWLLGYLGAIDVLLRAGVLLLLGFVALLALLLAGLFAAVLLVPPALGTGGLVAAGAVMLGAGAVAANALLGGLATWGAQQGLGLYPTLANEILPGVPLISLLVLLDFAGLLLLSWFLPKILGFSLFRQGTFAKHLDRLSPDLVALDRGHQVHPSVVACESELARGRRISHMFSLTDVRSPVWLNALFLRYFLRLINFLAHSVFVHGRLANAEGIHFAHWYVIDGGRRLLFCSNFDGTFGGYLDEFINGTSEGINLIWRWTELRARLGVPDQSPGAQPGVSHSREFPPTRAWAYGGCKHEQWFKAYARDSMLPHLHRFEAYSYTCRDLQRCQGLRDALCGAQSAITDDRILRALES